MDETPPVLRGVRGSEDDDMRPRSPRPMVVIVTWLCILGLVASVLAGMLSGF